ncbi:MAG: VWA domain-containing protein [Roseiflexaceae bacterium]|nr:VWA domain-containing protein [Roseiflexaceae bacterium]
MISISFIAPVALALLILLPMLWTLTLLAPRRLVPWRLWGSLTLRSSILIALVLAIAGIQIIRPVREVTTVFLLDASDSVAPSQREQASRYINQALAAMPANDQAAVVVFGQNALVERAPGSLAELGRIGSVPITTRTDIQSALQLGLALFPAETQKRLILLSDGGENSGRAADAARLAAVRGVPIDTIELPGERGPDVIVSGLNAPTSAREGQQISLSVSLSSSYATTGRLQVFVDGQLAGVQDLTLAAGKSEIAVQIPAGQAGFRRIEARLEAQGDTEPQNNRAAAFTEVQGPPRILLIASQPARAVALQSALIAVGVRVDLSAPNQAPATLTQLGDYAGVVIVDTPAREMPPELLKILPAYVQELGRGLAMIGGIDSYGAGGYRRAPADSIGRSLEDVLPVNLDPLDTTKQPDLALVMVIDRSGSMQEASGNSSRTKLDLAKEAVYQASLGLSQRDQIGLVVFDDIAETILPMQQLPLAADIERALGNFSAGGGTNIRPGVEQAAQALAATNARIKHVLLLTDGIADSNYGDLVDQMRSQGITISTIAIGSDANPNLADIAKRGGGRFIRVERAEQVPALFLQETVIVAGRDIVEQPVTPIIALQSPIVRDLGGLPKLYGYNGVETKQAARTILVTPDGKPVLAQWQYGLGRSVAWTSDMQGKWAKDWVGWNQFPSFVGGLVDLLLPPRDNGALTLRTTTSGAQSLLELTAVDPQGRPLNDLVLQSRLVAPDSTGSELRFNQVGPGRYRAIAETGNPGVYLAQVAAANANGQAVGIVTSGLAVSYSLEYSDQRSNPQLLRDMSTISGGRVGPPASAAFDPSPQIVGSVREIGLPLLWLALLLWPLDIAVRRLMLRASDVIPWLARRRTTASATTAPTLTRLNAAKQRAGTSMARTAAQVQTQDSVSPQNVASPPTNAASPSSASPPPTQPAEPPAPADAEERFARLMAAKQRARREKK